MKRHTTDIHKRYALLILFFYFIVYILPLGARDLFVPDETRYGDIPREMIAGGDWVVPHLDGLRYFEKPPLGYWVQAGSILLFGENSFAVRLPSALAVGLTALLIFALVRRSCRNGTGEEGSPAILAALVYLSSFEVVGVGNIAVLDSLFSFFLTATLIAFYVASDLPPGSAGERRFLLFSGLSCGLAFLTKGFLALAVPVLALVPYLVWQRRYFDLLRMSWLPILIAVLVALPWGILIHSREPDFWRFFFWNEHIRRFMADNAQHKQSFWFFFMAAAGLFMPWTFMTPAAVAGIRELKDEGSPRGGLLRFSVGWLALPFLFFSVAKGKLLTYVLPCFPPFSVLMAFGLSRTLAMKKTRAFQLGVTGTGIVFGLILLPLIYVQIFGYGGFRLYGQTWKATMLANGIVFSAIFFFWSLHCHHNKDKIVLFGVAPLLLFFLAHFLIPDLVVEKSVPGRLLEKHLYQIKPDTAVISCEEAVGAASWVLKRDDVYVFGSAGELQYGLNYKDSANRLLNEESATRLIDQNRGKAVLVCRAKRMRDLRNGLPKPAYKEDNGPDGYVFWKY